MRPVNHMQQITARSQSKASFFKDQKYSKGTYLYVEFKRHWSHIRMKIEQTSSTDTKPLRNILKIRVIDYLLIVISNYYM